jgi:hypothetical protein
MKTKINKVTNKNKSEILIESFLYKKTYTGLWGIPANTPNNLILESIEKNLRLLFSNTNVVIFEKEKYLEKGKEFDIAYCGTLPENFCALYLCCIDFEKLDELMQETYLTFGWFQNEEPVAISDTIINKIQELDWFDLAN